MTYVYLFGVMLALLLAVVLASVLKDREEDSWPDGEPEPEALRDAALEALRGLEFDYQTGKVPEEEYRALRRRYGSMALEARRKLAAGRDEPDPTEAPEPAAEREPEPPEATAEPEPDGSFCSACGTAVRPTDRFCGRCGARQPEPTERAEA